MALIACKHKVYGVCMVPDNYPDWYPDDWVAVDGELAEAAVAPGAGEPFDPTVHDLHGDGLEGRPLGVLDYLAAVADEAERARVIDVERNRTDATPRKTIVNWTPAA